MKLATLQTDSRDGTLVVVSQDLQYCLAVPAIGRRLQDVLDDWTHCARQLQQVYVALNQGKLTGQPFAIERCMSPLPRAYQWIDALAYPNHVELMSQTPHRPLPLQFDANQPIMYQGNGSQFSAGHRQFALSDLKKRATKVSDVALNLDFGAKVAVITDSLAVGSTAQQALQSVQLLMLVNDFSLISANPQELVQGFGYLQDKLMVSTAPIVVTPDELGDAWQDGRAHMTVTVTINGQPFAQLNAGQEMAVGFGDIIAHAAYTREITPGSVFGAGAISNKHQRPWGASLVDGGAGYACIAEQRQYETLTYGAAKTPFLQVGDQVLIEAFDQVGHSVFGTIHHVMI